MATLPELVYTLSYFAGSIDKIDKVPSFQEPVGEFLLAE
jgi:hypothetical protein